MWNKSLVGLSIAALSLTVAMGMPATAAPPAGRMQGRRPSAGQLQSMMNQRVDAQVDDLAKSLNLTASQKAKARAIFRETSRQMVPLFEHRPTNQQAMIAKIQSIAKDGEDRFMKVLTPAQKKKYAVYQQEHMAQMRARMRKGGMRPGGMRPGGNMMAPRH